MRGRLLLVLFLWLSWSQASAEESPSLSQTADEPMLLEPVVIADTRIPADPQHNPGHVTIITREQLDAMRASTAAEALRQLPGLHIDQVANHGGVSSIYLRGDDPNHTLVLIDGVRINDPTNSRGGSVDLSTLSAAGIERIEIARGPGSSVHGSDAMAGVINIVTTRGSGPPASAAELFVGALGDWRALVESRGAVDRITYAVSGLYYNGGEPVEGSRLQTAAFQAGVGFQPTERAELRANLRYAESRQEAFPDDSGGPRYAVIRDVDRRDADELTLGLTWSQALTSSQTLNTLLAYQHRRETLDSPGVAPGVRDPFGIPPNVSESDYRSYSVTINHLADVARGTRLTLGVTAQSEEGDSRGSLLIGGMNVPTSFALQRGLAAAFVEARYEPTARLVAQAGARLDLPEGEAAQASPRLGLLWVVPGSETALRVNWGRGFKLPSFFALGHPIVGNPGLKMERSESADLSASQPWLDERLTVSLTLFASRLRDVVDLAAGPPPLMVNRSLVTTSGAELVATLHAGAIHELPLLTLLPHVSYVRTDIAGTAEELRSRPQWRGGLTVRWQPTAAWRLNAEVLTVGRVRDSSIPTGDLTLDAYTRIDLAATWRPSPRWEIFAAIDNLLNARYEEAVGFPVRGIMPRIGARATL